MFIIFNKINKFSKIIMNKSVVLCILDGWGLGNDKENSAIAKADTKFFDYLMENYPNSQLEASGTFVGLPDGQMGNSEVGHSNIGAGRMLLQDLPRINKCVNEKAFMQNKVLVEALEEVKKNNGKMHLLGLLSDGGVHSHIDHIIELAKTIAENGVEVLLHAFLDGRDTQQKSAINYLEKFINETKDFPNIKIATVGGRYFGMDRDKRWDRVEKAYNVIVLGENSSLSPIDVVNNSYQNDITDEFIEPTSVNNYQGMEEGDGFIFCNYRADRARQISMALGKKDFDEFARKKVINFSSKIQMTEYSSEHSEFLKTLFGAEEIKDCLGEVISNNNLKQLRIAETEKYAHVTFFFNCGRENPFNGEERILVKSPNVATYDLQPEMSANEVNEKLIDAIKSNKFDYITVNFANPDMVGHTGSMDAAVKACETVDKNLEKLVNTVLEENGTIFVTADHGNVEKMIDTDGKPCTTHTTNKVPFIYISNNSKGKNVNNGALCDIAPTILKEMNIKQPELMTGKSLI